MLLFEGDQLPEGWFSSISTADTSLTALAAKWTRDFLKDRHDAEESLETLLNKNICKETAKANQVKNKAKEANKVRRVNRRTNALPDRPTDQPTNQRTQPVIEVLCRT